MARRKQPKPPTSVRSENLSVLQAVAAEARASSEDTITEGSESEEEQSGIVEATRHPIPTIEVEEVCVGENDDTADDESVSVSASPVEAEERDAVTPEQVRRRLCSWYSDGMSISCLVLCQMKIHLIWQTVPPREAFTQNAGLPRWKSFLPVLNNTALALCFCSKRTRCANWF